MQILRNEHDVQLGAYENEALELERTLGGPIALLRMSSNARTAIMTLSSSSLTDKALDETLLVLLCWPIVLGGREVVRPLVSIAVEVDDEDCSALLVVVGFWSQRSARESLDVVDDDGGECCMLMGAVGRELAPDCQTSKSGKSAVLCQPVPTLANPL